MSGIDNMRYDAELLQGVEQGSQSSTLRFFRFKNPTVSYGRLQKWDDCRTLVPSGWAAVQRPTGGGVVFHENDLCISLCWPRGQAPLPFKPTETYQWIHRVIHEALGRSLRMASCADACAPSGAFATRQCFTQPVGFDLLNGTQKVVGGALRCTHRATLYQGSLQMIVTPDMEMRLSSFFQTQLAAGS